MAAEEKRDRQDDNTARGANTAETTTIELESPTMTGLAPPRHHHHGWLTGTVFGISPEYDTKALLREIVWVNALPIVLGSGILYISIQTITLIFVGHRLNKEEMSHYVIAMSIFTVTGLSMGVGFSSALDTLCSQAYGRSPHSAEVAQRLQQGIFLSALFLLPIIIFFLFFAEPVLILLLGADVGHAVSAILRHSPCYLLINVCAGCVQRALNAQNASFLTLYGYAAAALVVTPINYFLTTSGPSAVWSMTLSHLALLVTMTLVGWKHPRSVLPRARWPFDPEVLNMTGLKEFLVVAFPSTLSCCAEWWAFEVLNFTVVHLGDTATDAFNIAYSLNIALFCSSGIGLGNGCSVTLGNALGAGDERKAMIVARISYILTIICGLVNATLVFVFHRQVFGAFTTNREVLDQLSAIAYLVCILHVGDVSQYTLQGAFRGAGLQNRAAKITWFSLWMIGLPGSLLCSFKLGMGIRGTYIGFLFGLFLATPVLLFDMIKRWDWIGLREAAERSSSLATGPSGDVDVVDGDNKGKDTIELEDEEEMMNLPIVGGNGRTRLPTCEEEGEDFKIITQMSS